MIHLTVNGELIELQRPLTVTELLKQLDLAQGPVAVERNRSIVTRAQHSETTLVDGDVLEIVHFVGGG